MIKVETQQNCVFKGRYEMQRKDKIAAGLEPTRIHSEPRTWHDKNIQSKDTTLVKTDDPKTIIPFHKRSNITSTN